MVIGLVYGAALALLATLPQSKPADSTTPFWSLVDRPMLEKFGSLNEPCLLALPDGTLLASIDRTAHRIEEGTNVYRSTDRGRTWHLVERGLQLTSARFFLASKDVGLIGIGFGARFPSSDVVVCRSKTGGETWSDLWTATKGSFDEKGAFYASGAGLVQAGRVWMPFKHMVRLDGEFRARLVVASIDVDSDFMESDRWTWSEPLEVDKNVSSFDLWSILPAPGSTPVVRMRGKGGTTQALADFTFDGARVRLRDKVPAWTDPTDAAGWARPLDTETGRTFVLTLRRRPREGAGDSAVVLQSSADKTIWRTDSVLVHDERPEGVTFVSADWCITGDDLLVVVCGYGWGPDERGDSPEALARGGLHFLRIPGFRTRSMMDPPLWEGRAPDTNEPK